MRGLKKVFNKKSIMALLAIGMAAALTGCGSSGANAAADTAGSYDSSYKQAVESVADFGSNSGVSVTEAAAEEASGGSGTGESYENTAATRRKLIRTVDMDVETQEYDALLSAVERKTQELGGYIEQVNTYNGSYYSYGGTRSADMTIRIPQENLDTFLDALSGISNIVRRSETVEDVTLTYVDLESHRDALSTEQERLLELLEQAETVEDMIIIEERLSNVRYQLESMESQLRTYDNQVDYSTVSLYINEVEVYTPVEEESIGERISLGFSESLHDIGEGFVNFGVWFVVTLPYMIVWAVIIGLLALIFYGVVKLFQRSGSAKRQKRQNNNQVRQENRQESKGQQENRQQDTQK